MREFQQLTTDVIHESPTNPRRSFTEAGLDDLTASVRRHGVLQPILVRPNGDGYRARSPAPGACVRRSSRDAPRCPRVCWNSTTPRPTRPRSSRTSTARTSTRSTRASAIQRLVAGGRPIDEVAAALGKSKGYVYQRISLTRLVPKVQDLLARDVLPLIYALKIAVVPAEQQEEALAQCFRPLFRDEAARATSWNPLAQLTGVDREDGSSQSPQRRHARAPARAGGAGGLGRAGARRVGRGALDPALPHGQGRPEADSGQELEAGRRQGPLCSTHGPGVIVLGEGQGTFLQVCIAKKTCEKHWGRPAREQVARPQEDTEAVEARQRQEAAWAKQRERAGAVAE